ERLGAETPGRVAFRSDLHEHFRIGAWTAFNTPAGDTLILGHELEDARRRVFVVSPPRTSQFVDSERSIAVAEVGQHRWIRIGGDEFAKRLRKGMPESAFESEDVRHVGGRWASDQAGTCERFAMVRHVPIGVP